MKHVYNRTYVMAMIAGAALATECYAQTLPTTEQFSDLLRSCAAGANIQVSADLIGSISSIYQGQRTQGAASFQSSTEFLKLIPENSRLEAYKLYTECIKSIVQPH